MKHFLTGVAVVAALAFSAPAWAQPTPGQGGFGPKASGGNYIPPSTPPAVMAPSAEAPPTSAPPLESTAPTRAFGKATRGRHHMEAAGGMPISATPPMHRHARHMAHGNMPAHHRGKGPQLTGSTAQDLNQQELARLQAANMSLPGTPPAPGMAPPSRVMGTTPGEPPYPGSPGPKSSGHGG
jgi:hypothetical protein